MNYIVTLVKVTPFSYEIELDLKLIGYEIQQQFTKQQAIRPQNIILIGCAVKGAHLPGIGLNPERMKNGLQIN